MPRLTEDSPLSSPSASTSQEGLEGGARSASNRKLRVTLLSSEWRSTKGGLSTINRELAIQLAKHSNVEVSMYLPQCTEEDKTAAAGHKVCLIEAEEMPGYDPVDWLATIPKDHVMDCVIGHGVHLGRQVPHIKRLHSHCKWIQVVHTDPEELGMFKSYANPISRAEKKHQAEVKLCKLADQVVAVGSKLAEAFAAYLRSCRKDQDVFNLTPSIFTEFKDVTQATEERKTFRVLVFGRGDNEDFQLKGYDIAAKAIAELKDTSQPYKLVFVGAPVGEEEKVTALLLEEGIARSQLAVRHFNESREHLAELFCEVDLAIMPSRTEGFGLTALEALSAGLPVLVSSNSGLGDALKKVPYGSNCVVDSEDPGDWAKAIRAVREKDRRMRLKEAKVLCGEYAEEHSWEKQCSKLVERMLNITQGVAFNQEDLSIRERHIAMPTTEEDPSHSMGLQGGSSEKQVSGKSKMLLSSSETSAPKQRKVSTIGPEGSSEAKASGSGKRPSSPSDASSPKKRKLLTAASESSAISTFVVSLKNVYKQRSELRPQIAGSNIKLDLEKVYTRLKIILRPKGFVPSRGNEVNVYNILEAHNKGEDVMALAEGSPGIGKTTLCLKLAYDWVVEDVAATIAFSNFDFVLLLKCRDIDGDIMEAINEQLLPEDINEEKRGKVLEFISDISNQRRILIVLDGLDELPENSKDHIDKLLARRILPCCSVFATCRQERGIEVRKDFKFDFLLQIEGFTESDACKYIRKHFEHFGPDISSKGDRLIEEIKENTFLHALRNNPLNLLLLCIIYEDYEGNLPSSRTKLYQVIVCCLLRRYCAKHDLKAPENDRDLEKQFRKDILALGKLAWKCLLDDRHSFREDKLKEVEKRNESLVARGLGLLYKEESLKRLKPQHEYCFLHKTFQEYLAAFYIAQKLRRKKFDVLDQLAFDDLVVKYPQVFLFVSGLLGEEASLLFDQIGKKLEGAWDWHYCDDRSADFFVNSFNENENGGQMAVSLCSFVPFPVDVHITDDEFSATHNFVRVLVACKRFSSLQKPLNLSVTVQDEPPFSLIEDIRDIVESCLQLKTLTVTCDKMMKELADIHFESLSTTTSLSKSTLTAMSESISSDTSIIIGEGLVASKTIKQVTLTFPGVFGEACLSGLDTALSADTPLVSAVLTVNGPVNETATQALQKIVSKNSLTSLSLTIRGDMQDILAVALCLGLAGQISVNSLDLFVDGKLSCYAAKLLERGLLENRSLNDLRVFLHGELPDNWRSVVENVQLANKSQVSFAFYPNNYSKVAAKQVTHFRPFTVEEGFGPKQHLIVNFCGELTVEGAEALREVLCPSLSRLTINLHGKLTDGFAHFSASCIDLLKTLSSITVNIWGKLTEEEKTLSQDVIDKNPAITLNVHGVPFLPDESQSDFKISIDNPASLATLIMEAKNAKKEKISLTINAHRNTTEYCNDHSFDVLAEDSTLKEPTLTTNSYSFPDWDRGLGDGLKCNTSLHALTLTVNDYGGISGRWGEGLGDGLKGNTTLHALTLTVNNYGDISGRWGEGLGNGLKGNTSLRALTLTVNDKYGDVSGGRGWGEGLGNGLKCNTSLHALTLTVNNYGDFSGRWGEGLGIGLQSNTSLHALTLTVNNYCDFGGVWGEGLGNGLQSNTSIRTLTLTVIDYGDISGVWGEGLRNGLEYNTTISELTLIINNYMEFCIPNWGRVLGDVFSKNRSVHTLSLTINNYGELPVVDMERLCEGLAQSKSLTSCNLAFNMRGKVSDDYLPRLCKKLMRSESLTTLTLQVSDPQLSNGSSDYDLSKVLVKSRSLSSIDLTVSFYGTETNTSDT